MMAASLSSNGTIPCRMRNFVSLEACPCGNETKQKSFSFEVQSLVFVIGGVFEVIYLLEHVWFGKSYNESPEV